jgi:hypothetical protein
LTVPYITDDEVLHRTPTSSIGWGTYPTISASTRDREAERAKLILDASSWIDTEADQKLYATHDVETLARGTRRFAMRDGRLYIRTKFSPIISVQAVETSSDGVAWSPLGGNVVIASRSAFWVVNPSASGYLPGFPIGQFIRSSYTDGYPNSALATAAAASATQIVLTDAVGCVPGGGLTLYDVEHTEEVVVAPEYVPEATTIPLVAPLVFDHGAGIIVSAVPDEVRYVARLVIAHQVRLRTREMVAAGLAEGGRPQPIDQTDLAEAKARLKAYRRNV